MEVDVYTIGSPDLMAAKKTIQALGWKLTLASDERDSDPEILFDVTPRNADRAECWLRLTAQQVIDLGRRLNNQKAFW